MKRVLPHEARQWQGRIIDVRGLDEFASQRLEGAECVPLERLVSEASTWDPQDCVLLLCKSGMRAAQGAQLLEQVGFRDVRIVEGGIEACRKAGLAVHRDRRVLPIQQQVFIGSGLMLLAALGLSLIHPWFMAIVWLAAGMMVIAGWTGFCPMAIILRRMPWNRQSSSGGGSCAANCSTSTGAA